MLPVKEAESIILDLVEPLDHHQDVEVVDLLSAHSRILAVPVMSRLDFPHWDNSAMDGYAVRYKDVAGTNAQQPVQLEIVEEIPAGYKPQVVIKPGQAARILTGSMMPEGADTVVIQEVTRREGDRVVILAEPAESGAFVRHQGSFYKAGNPLLPAGIAIQAPEIAVLAAAQCTQMKVYRRPRVAIISTGNELVTPERPLQPGQIVDSNQYALAAAVTAAGAVPVLLGIVPDEPEALKETIAKAVATADVVLSTGGVSVGDYDYVDEILATSGAKIHVTSVAIKPGKPLTVATFPPSSTQQSVLYFGLPGNPVSSLVTFWRFVEPAVKKLAGLYKGWQPVFLPARTQYDLRSDGKRESYLWGQLHLIDGVYRFQLAGGSHSSGNLINLAQTTGLAVVPVGKKLISAGECVEVMQLGLPVSH
ncbi:gephyrin-like molybdotransferase Glp [Microcoleus sp. FACHB-672]|uniref:molybdopterin molybdotransferase MoeA n=1 Tax=Microcoleus sp. FACHB-672 TaxID=2692825 RepID=UPI0016856072|nr:gephyrin-like molybdotransferase Glp [Microcoleus sp. FACHB-672]MBD2043459.1 molybdopterin molybdotransferase MoeA [Microcoleus sp. FACHB-672]